MRLVAVFGALLVTSALAHTAVAAPGTRLSEVTQVTALGTVTPGRVAPGGMVALSATFNSPAPISAINFALEVHDPGGALVFKRVLEGQSIAPAQSRTLAVSWALPPTLAPGNYSIKLGAFSTDYTISYAWNETAASFVIVDGFGSLTPTTYYMDCAAGSDSNSGTQAGLAWASLDRLNTAVLQPGDTVKFRSDCVWTGTIQAVWNGAPDHPITFTAFGSGDLPSIQNGDSAEISVTGSYLVFDQLNLHADPVSLDTACNNNPIGRRIGIFFDSGATHNVVQNSVVEGNSAGIDLGGGSSQNTVRHNEIRNNNMMDSVDPYEDDGGGNGVLIQGDSNDVSYNHISGSLACSTRYVKDGSAFELYGATNNRIHHNTIDSNYIFGEFAQSTDNEFAYNVSTDGGVTNHWDANGTKLYNNVFYVPGGAGIVSCLPCAPGAMSLVNNIFVSPSAIYADAGVTEDHNIYWDPVRKPYLYKPMDPTSMMVNPQLVDPANGNFQLLPTSRAVGAGSHESVDHGYIVDGQGNAVGGTVDIGSFQLR